LLNALLLAFLIAAPAAPQLPSVRLFDPGRFLSSGEQEKIQQSLDAYAKESKHEVIVYIDRSTGGQPAASWCRETFNRWRAERPSLDDGVAVFLFTEDRTAVVTPGEHLIAGFIPERTDTICRTLVDSIELNQHDAGMDGALVDVRHAIESPMGQQLSGAVERRSEGPVWDAIDRIPRWAFTLFMFLLLGLGFLWAIRHPRQALQVLGSMIVGAIFDSAGTTFGGDSSSGGGGFSGGGGSFGGGGASGQW
jgi:uncharacterized protein